MKKYINLFFKRITKDFRHKELLPVKLLFFIHASSILVLYPYITIHMRELGINVEETAIMYAITPVTAIFMPPLAGILADKIGNFRILLAIFSGVGGAAALLMLLVPVGRITVTYPEQVVMEVGCFPGSPLSMSLYQHYPCEPLHPYTYDAELRLQACGFTCRAILSRNDSEAVFNSREYGIQFHNIHNNKTKVYTYTISEKDRQFPPEPEPVRHTVLKNDVRYTTAIRKLSKNSYFFPSYSLYDFSCDLRIKEFDANSTEEEVVKGYNCIFGSSPRRFSQGTKVGIKAEKQSDDDIAEERHIYDVDYLGAEKYSATCLKGFGQNGQHISVNLPLYETPEDTESYKDLNLGSCAPRCIATIPRKQVCTKTSTVVEFDVKLTFWTYLLARVFVGIISGTAFSMFEGAVIAILREHKADYGLQRIYATIGGMISSPLSGWLIDFASRGKAYTDFRPVFFLYAGMKILSAAFMLFINLEFKTPATSVVADVLSVMRNAELITLFIACFVLGIAWGYIESFLFWLLEDLGGSKSLMGLTITVGGIVGIPLLVLSGPIIKKVGHANIIFIGFIFYAIRLLGYSLIYNPWLSLIFEAMESITFSLSFTAAVTYAAKLSTVTTDTSVQGMLGGLYYGVGKGAGSLIGGYLIKATSIRTTFQIFAGSTAVTGFVYLAFYHLYLKRKVAKAAEKRDLEKTPEGFVDVDLPAAKAANGIQEHEIPATYEDALTNLGYEDTETEEQNR